MSAKNLMSGSGIVNLDTSCTGDTGVLRDSNGDVLTLANKGGVAQGLSVTGFVKLITNNKTSGFTIDETLAASTNGSFYTIDTTGGSVTVVLPLAASSTGRVLSFKKTIAANSLILDGNGSETIDGATTKTATAQFAAYSIICDGTAWHAISAIGSWS